MTETILEPRWAWWARPFLVVAVLAFIPFCWLADGPSYAAWLRQIVQRHGIR